MSKYKQFTNWLCNKVDCECMRKAVSIVGGITLLVAAFILLVCMWLPFIIVIPVMFVLVLLTLMIYSDLKEKKVRSKRWGGR